MIGYPGEISQAEQQLEGTRPHRYWSRLVRVTLFLVPVAYMSALLATTLHEMIGHGLTALAVGGRFDGFIVHFDGTGRAMAYPGPNGSPLQSIAIGAGGIVFTTVVGIILLFAAKRFTSSNHIRLVILTASVACLFAGPRYLFWNAYMPDEPGDIGKILAASYEAGLGSPVVLRWVFMLLGAGISLAWTAGLIWLIFRGLERQVGAGTSLSGLRRAALMLIVLAGIGCAFAKDPRSLGFLTWIDLAIILLTGFGLYFIPTKPFDSTPPAPTRAWHIAAAWACCAALFAAAFCGRLSRTSPADALIAAASTGQVDRIRSSLERGVDPKARDGALWTAATRGNAEAVTSLLNANADVNAVFRESTPLFMAAQKGHVEIVRLLLAAKADVNRARTDGTGPLFMAAQKGHTEIVKLLLDSGADVNATSTGGATALMAAAQNGHTEIVKLLLASHADVSGAHSDGSTALHVAAQNGHVEILKLLLASKADANAARQDGMTALYIAAANWQTDVVRELLAANAEVNAATKDGATPLMIAAEEGRTDIVELLLKNKADVDARCTDGRTALWMAAQEGYLGVVNLLLAYGADVNAARTDGTTPLSAAVGAGHRHIVERLLNAGANVSAVARFEGEDWTALRIAQEQGHADIVKLLKERGAQESRPSE